MRLLLATFLVELFLVAGLNYAVDPGHQWSRGHNDAPPRAIQPGEVWLWPPIIEDHVSRWEQIRTIPKPGLLSFGSCRSFVIDSTLFQPSARYFNAGVGEISAYDYVALWQALVENEKVPERLLIFIDPWVLNRHNGEINRWGYNASYIDRFIADHPIPGLQRGWVLYQRMKAPFMMEFVRLQTLIRIDTLKRSLRFLASRQAEAPVMMREGDVPADRFGYRSDGSVAHWVTPVDLPALRQQADTAGHANPVFNLGRWEVDPSVIAILDTLFKEFAHRKVRAAIIVSPYHPLEYQILRERPGYSHIFSEVASTLQQTAAPYPMVRICNAGDPALSGCRDDEFFAPTEMNRQCAAKVLAYCFQDWPDWKSTLSHQP